MYKIPRGDATSCRTKAKEERRELGDIGNTSLEQTGSSQGCPERDRAHRPWKYVSRTRRTPQSEHMSKDSSRLRHWDSVVEQFLTLEWHLFICSEPHTNPWSEYRAWPELHGNGDAGGPASRQQAASSMSHLEKAREWGLGWKLVSYIPASSSQTRGSSVPRTHLMRGIPAARPSLEGRGVTDTDRPGLGHARP